MTISDAQFERIKENQPRVSYSSFIDEASKTRMGYAYLALTLLSQMHLHSSWAFSYPTVEDLGMAQGEPINPDAGPTEKIMRIYEFLQKAMFTPEGFLDLRVSAALRAYGFKVTRALSQYDDDHYNVCTLRGYFVVYPPEQN